MRNAIKNWLLRKLMGDFEWQFFRANPMCITQHLPLPIGAAYLNIPAFEVTAETHKFVSMIADRHAYVFTNTQDGLVNDVWHINRLHFRMKVASPPTL